MGAVRAIRNEDEMNEGESPTVCDELVKKIQQLLANHAGRMERMPDWDLSGERCESLQAFHNGVAMLVKEAK